MYFVFQSEVQQGMAEVTRMECVLLKTMGAFMLFTENCWDMQEDK
jgi:hypothetical protein